MKKRAQSTFEYAVLITLVVSALAVMAVYAKRALQGRIRAGADQISSEAVYMPGETAGSSEVKRNITEDSASYVDKTDGRRDSITDAKVNIEQKTRRDERVDAPAGGG